MADNFITTTPPITNQARFTPLSQGQTMQAISTAVTGAAGVTEGLVLSTDRPLLAGLSLSPLTGVISGTPLATSPTVSYTITGLILYLTHS